MMIDYFLSTYNCKKRLSQGPDTKQTYSTTPYKQNKESKVHLLHSAPPLTRSAALQYARFVRLLRSLAPQCSAMLASLACSVHGLAHSLCSLPRGTAKIHEYVFTLLTRYTATNAFLIFTENTLLVLVSPMICDAYGNGF